MSKKNTIDIDSLTADKVAKMTKDEQAKIKNALLGKATIELREKHQGEFEEIATALFAKVGLTRQRRLTPDERKRAELERLAAELGVDLTASPADQ